MKKYTLVLAMLFLPFLVHADGGFLNVDISVNNQNFGKLTTKDFSYKVTYDGGSDTLTGRIQAFDFPRHTNINTPLVYSVTPIVPAGYSAKLSEEAPAGATNSAGDPIPPHCTGTLPANRNLLVNCSIYFQDDLMTATINKNTYSVDTIPAQIKASISTPTPTQQIIIPPTPAPQVIERIVYVDRPVPVEVKSEPTKEVIKVTPVVKKKITQIIATSTTQKVETKNEQAKISTSTQPTKKVTNIISTNLTPRTWWKPWTWFYR